MNSMSSLSNNHESLRAPSNLDKLEALDPNLSILFTPIQLGPLTLPNKFFMAALTRDRNVNAPSTAPTDLMVEYYRQRARGGAGLIISEALLVVQHGNPWPHAAGIWSDEHVRGWKKITDAVHEEGTYIYAQLWHPGRVGHIDAPEQIASGEPVYGPSPIGIRPSPGALSKYRFLPGSPTPSVPVEIKDPHKFIELYKQAAINAKRAGFDGIELHAGSGMLIHQFLDNTTNKRTDSWGGSVENRAKFGLEVIKAITDPEVFGPGRVGMRMSPTGGYNDVGMPLEDTLETFKYFVTEADKLDLAYMMFARYGEVMDELRDGKYRGTPHDVIQTYKPLVHNCKFFSNLGYTPLEAAEQITSGQVDGVFFGSLWIANPDLPKRVRYGIPLNEVDISKLYGSKDGSVLSEEELAKGYTDYPFAEVPLAN